MSDSHGDGDDAGEDAGEDGSGERKLWQDEVVGERMQLDGEFGGRVQESSLNGQQWELVMTATEFEIEHPEDPERATLVADTSRLDAVLPEMDRMDRGGGRPGATGGGGSGGSDGGGGVFGGIAERLGLGGGDGDDDRREASERLAAEYAERLQERLEENGRWEGVCASAAAESGGSEPGESTEEG